MKILYIHQYFKTPEEGGSIRSYYLAKGLVDAGHEVTMITAHNSPHKIESIEGIRVHYLPVFYDNNFGFIQRIKSFWSFVKQTKREAKKLLKHDLAYVMTTPLTTGFIATYLKKKMRLPYYFEVGDLWPEAPIQMGVIKNRRLKKWLYSLEKRFYLEAEKVIALSPDIRDYVKKVSPNTRVHVIPNMADCHFFEPIFSVGKFGADNLFKITYCGAIGKANHLEYFLDAARQSKEAQLPVHFNVIGYGSELKRMHSSAQQLDNITFYPHANKQSVKDLLDKSDAVYVSFKDVKVLGTGSPNKFFDALAAGKLTIINFQGWIKDVITKNECGFHYNPNIPTEFVQHLKPFLASPDLLTKYQHNGRKLAELYYDKDIQVKRLLQILNNEDASEKPDAEVYILTS